jgi:hypothetical protein
MCFFNPGGLMRLLVSYSIQSQASCRDIDSPTTKSSATFKVSICLGIGFK